MGLGGHGEDVPQCWRGHGLRPTAEPVIRDRRQSRRHAAYMAMRLAVALEAYSEGCADLVQRNAREAPRRNEEPSARTMALPTPPHYPEDLDGWKAIDHTLADRCLSFESRTRQSQAIIASIIGDGRRLAGELETQAIERGLEAWDLAVELRKRHRLRPIQSTRSGTMPTTCGRGRQNDAATRSGYPPSTGHRPPMWGRTAAEQSAT